MPYLLGQDRGKTCVKSAYTFGLGHLDETVGQSVTKLWIRNRANADSLKRAKENVGNKFGARGSTEVDGGLLLPCLLFAKRGGGFDLRGSDLKRLNLNISSKRST